MSALELVMMRRINELNEEVKRLNEDVKRLAADSIKDMSHIAELTAEVERLRKAGDAMASSIQFNEEMAKDYNGPTIVRQCVKEWLAAKEDSSR